MCVDQRIAGCICIGCVRGSLPLYDNGIIQETGHALLPSRVCAMFETHNRMHGFQRIGCAGCIKIRKPPVCGIQILKPEHKMFPTPTCSTTANNKLAHIPHGSCECSVDRAIMLPISVAYVNDPNSGAVCMHTIVAPFTEHAEAITGCRANT